MAILGNRVNQENIVAGGDVAAGDIYKTINNFGTKQRTNLSEACEKFKSGISEEKQDFIEKLADYMEESSDQPAAGFRSLEEKLTGGGMKAKLKRAMRLKERFAKKLQSSTFNELLQEVYALILVEIDSAFEHRVRPLVESKKTTEAEAETHKIYSEIETQLHGLTDITKADMEGMLYYLAGKCYIDWGNG